MSIFSSLIGQLGDFLYMITSVIMSLIIAFGGASSPSTDAVIGSTSDKTVMDFVVVGDPQVCNYNPQRELNFIAAAEDIMNSEEELDAFIIAGDIAENGFEAEYDAVAADICALNTKNFIMAAGNHDIRLRDYEQSKATFLDFMNSLNGEENAQDSLYYRYDVEGYTFLVMGSEEARFEDAYISEEQLNWLDTEAAAATKNGKPVFVVIHYPLKDTHGLPATWNNSLWESGSVGDQSDEIYTILNKYENVILITGHLHTGFGEYTYEKIGDIHGINVPSVGIENKDGEYNDAGTGFYVEVSADEVVFHARDFAKGVNLPDYDIAIELQ